jgi:hypothetical protein
VPALALVIRRLLTDRRFRALLVTVGPVAATELRRLAEQGRFRQVAIRHADTLVHGRVSREVADGQTVYVVWTGAEPVMSYPPVSGDLDDVLRHADPENRRSPEELPTRRVRTAAASAGRAVGRAISGIIDRTGRTR